MFTTQTCVIIGCDECHKPIPFGSDDWDGHPHFPTEVEAIAGLGWDPDDEDQEGDASRRGLLAGYQLTATTLPDRPAGQVLCTDCLVPLVCAARGHRWDEWHLCRCRRGPFGDPCKPRLADHAAGCPEIRRCDRSHCYENEQRPAAPREVPA